MFLGYKFPDTDCSLSVEIWFALFGISCPIITALAFILACWSNKHRNFHAYTWETRYEYFEIWTNSDRRINWTIMMIECFNLLWAFSGIIIDNVAGDPS